MQWVSASSGRYTPGTRHEKLFAEEFPDWDPFPSGPKPWIGRIVRQILLAEPLAAEFGHCFAGVGPARAAQLADSFTFTARDRNERLAGLVSGYAGGPHGD